MKKLLIVEDEAGARESLRGIFGRLYEVHAVESAGEALAYLSRERTDLIILDLLMPEMSGTVFLKEARQWFPDLPILVVTATASDDLTREALSLGAVGLIRKPWDNQELRYLAAQAIDAGDLPRQREVLGREVERGFSSNAPVGQSSIFRKAMEMARNVAGTHVLLSGERGTGKEAIGRQIHAWSRRALEPFVALCCRELSGEFVEAEIFGKWDRATQKTRLGAIELARDSTLFLENIDSLPLHLQEALVRLIQRGVYQRPNSQQVVPSSARLMATLERPAQEAVAAGTLLPELLDAFLPGLVPVPALRERRDDIPLLAHHFLHLLRTTLHLQTLDISPGAMQKLRDYHWPGNVRELRNVIERVLFIYGASRQIGGADLPHEFSRPSVSPDGKIDFLSAVAAFEKQLISAAFERCNGTVTAAAKLLGITPRKLQLRVDRHRIVRSPYKLE